LYDTLKKVYQKDNTVIHALIIDGVKTINDVFEHNVKVYVYIQAGTTMTYSS